MRTAWVAGRLPEADVMDFVVVRIAIDYRRELTLADRAVLARCAFKSLGTSSVRTSEQVLTEDGEPAADAEAVLVARDPATGAARPLTEAERAALST